MDSTVMLKYYFHVCVCVCVFKTLVIWLQVTLYVYTTLNNKAGSSKNIFITFNPMYYMEHKHYFNPLHV